MIDLSFPLLYLYSPAIDGLSSCFENKFMFFYVVLVLESFESLTCRRVNVFQEDVGAAKQLMPFTKLRFLSMSVYPPFLHPRSASRSNDFCELSQETRR